VDCAARGGTDPAGMRHPVPPRTRWKILGQMGRSCQRPAGRALERDEAAGNLPSCFKGEGVTPNSGISPEIIVDLRDSVTTCT